MSGFLGYHPERVLALRRALASALAEAQGIRCDEAEAASARRLWHRAIERMVLWEPRLVAVSGCGFHSPYQPVDAGLDLPVDYVRADAAWAVVTDPLSAAPPPPDLLARADELVALLLALPPSLLSDAADAERLAELLTQVLGSADSRARFLALLGPDGYAAVVAALARAVATEALDPATARRATTLLRPLAAGLGHAVRAGLVGSAPFLEALLDGTFGDAFAAALVLRYAELPTSVTVSWAMDITRRAAADPAGLGTLAPRPGYGTHALVVEALTDDPAAGRQVLRLLEDLDLDLLLGAHVDGDVRGRFLVATTDRDRFDGPATVELLNHVLAFLRAHPEAAESRIDQHELRGWLGRVVGPWMVELVPRPEAVTPGTPADDPVARLAWVATDPQSAADMKRWLPHVSERASQEALRPRPGDAPGDGLARLDDVAARLGVVVGAIERGRTELFAELHKAYEDGTTLMELAAGRALAKLGDLWVPRSSLLTELALDPLAEGAVNLAEDHGWIDEPPTRDEAATTSAIIGDKQEATVLAAMMGALHVRQVASGQVPVASPSLPAPAPGTSGRGYVGELVRWSQADRPNREATAEIAGVLQERVTEGRQQGRRPAAAGPLEAVYDPDDPRSTLDDPGNQQLELQGEIKGVPGLLGG